MPEAKTKEVAPGVSYSTLPLPMKPTIVNVYLVRGTAEEDDDAEWALVDTGIGSKDSIAAFKSCLEIVGCRPEQLRKIVVTHHHPDHYGCARPYRDLTGAEVYVHPAEWERSKNFMPSERPQWVIDWFSSHGMPLKEFGRIPKQKDFWQGMYRPVAPDVELSDGAEIRVGERTLRAVWTPGHAAGHCVIYLPEERLMIAGDHLLPRITPHVGFGPGSEGNPLGDFIASQKKIQQLDVDLVLPAHGGVFPKSHEAVEPDHPAPRGPTRPDHGHPASRAAHGLPDCTTRLQLRRRQSDYLSIPRHLRDPCASRIPSPRRPGRHGGRLQRCDFSTGLA